MNTLLICLTVGQLACVFALAWMGYHATHQWHVAEEINRILVRHMNQNGLPIPTREELEDYINDREDNA